MHLSFNLNTEDKFKTLNIDLKEDRGKITLKRKTISLFGPTDSEKFAPEYEKSIVLDSKKLYNTKNVSAITVEDVLNAVKQHLNY